MDDEFEKNMQMPIYKKAEEILKLVEGFVELTKESDQPIIANQTEWLMENAFLIPTKIMGAEGADLYDLRMENAALIRKAAREIFVNVGGMRYLGFEDHDYIYLIRKEIDEFKILFREWVKSFDPWNYVLDDWGLFNPPGVEPDDDEE